MSKGGKPSVDVFDIDRIRQIVELMEEHALSEVDLQQGDDKIKLCRGGSTPIALPAPVAPAAPVVAPAAAPAPAAEAAPADGTFTIDAPMVGTFYARPKPEADTFVQVGSVIGNDTVVCIVEAMKVFNEIPAECSGKVIEVLVQDGEAVDFGKPLFRVQP
ncbi:MAG: acetyl-CoA carboxylase biotin carboxyl carrier protein [Planctomycetota bacterium]